MINEGRRRGRPRSFDTTLAVSKAAEVFWSNGYEGSSVPELTKAMGITTQSMYAAFGSKADLYKLALEWYRQEIASFGARALDEEAQIIPSLRRLLSEVAVEYTRPDRPTGCMVSSAVILCASEHEEVAKHARSLRAGTEDRLRSRFDQAKNSGQLSQTANPEALARYIHSVMIGMSVLAQDGASADDLMAIVESTIAGLPTRLS